MSRRHTTEGPGRFGFSLVEMMTVTLIIGVVAAMALPAVFGQNERAQRDQALAQLSAYLDAARGTAMRRRAPVQVRFDAVNEELDVWADLNRNGIADAGESASAQLLGDGVVDWVLPAQSGTFSSKGLFSSSSGYWRVAAGTHSLSNRYFYVFPSGEFHETNDYQ